MTAMVRAEQVCKDFGALPVLKGVTLSVERGRVLVLVGPSGSGKSTFLRCINHLETVTAGRLYVDGVLVGYRESRGNNERAQDRHAHLLCSQCVRIEGVNGIAIVLVANCFEKQRHFHRTNGSFIALVVNARAAAINRLLFSV
jgi:ABC-type methionine transport system ATPase subunit